MTSDQVVTHPWQPAQVRELPAVLGPLHGTLQVVGRGASTAIYLEPSLEIRGVYRPTTSVIVYHTQRVVWVMPGRTDRQRITVLVAESPLGLPDIEWVIDALLAVWAGGWSPPPESSEFWPDGPPGRVEYVHRSGVAPDRRGDRAVVRLRLWAVAVTRRAVRVFRRR